MVLIRCFLSMIEVAVVDSYPDLRTMVCYCSEEAAVAALHSTKFQYSIATVETRRSVDSVENANNDNFLPLHFDRGWTKEPKVIAVLKTAKCTTLRMMEPMMVR